MTKVTVFPMVPCSLTLDAEVDQQGLLEEYLKEERWFLLWYLSDSTAVRNHE